MATQKDAKKLKFLMEARQAPGANKEQIDAEIYSKFGYIQAIMFTDLAGFTKTTEDYGILHFLQLIQASEELFMPIITKYGGTCLQHQGDSLLIVFDDAPSALDAAIEMGNIADETNKSKPIEDRIYVYIGMGYGLVLKIDDKDVWGSEVNRASKLLNLAESGEILVTENFERAVPDATFQRIKNLYGKKTYIFIKK